jgi:diacylglycerol kinase family enzyme
MKGRYCGGGMMLAPGQDRHSGKLTVIVYMSKSKLKSLMNFPKIFEGKHVELTNMVKVIEGKKVYVRFSEPCAVQIDGETILNVREYWAEA